MKRVFEGRKIVVYAGEYTLPNNVEVYREYVDFGESISVVAVEDNKILLIKQFRMPVGRWIYEVPAGTLEEGEEPIECAERELIEETGYKAGKLTHLFDMYLAPGYSNEYMHIYLAEDLEYVGARPEKGELIKVEWRSLNDIIEMIRGNMIMDAKSIASLLYYISYVKNLLST